MNDKFSVSIKGILHHEGKYLFRKNQRNEFELLGGKLEANDISMEERVIEEFLEESGINVKVNSYREPWLYVVDKKNIIIIPFVCSVINIPDVLFDEDGGELSWISDDKLDKLSILPGYLDTVYNKIPRKSFSPFKGKYLKIIPNYIEKDYEVIVRVKDLNNNFIIEKTLNNFIAPRDFITQHIGDIKLLAQPTIF
ncbi:MAG: hypothetical protein WBG30_01505, partial [Psychrilyobacter sp.]|uniref:hypothetical protein n=1 Tax=Psychrilyobacter sp. TaxID=2586924 RepID=UPI003C7407E3